VPRKFEFRLQPVLRARELAEQQVQRKFATVSAEIGRLDRLDALAAAEIRARQSALLGRQRDVRLDTAPLSAERAWINRLRFGILERSGQRRELQDRVQILRAELVAARTKTRVLERLKERRRAEHDEGCARWEQTQMDEVAQQLYVRNQPQR
jgi:flagellar protein FliJ